MYFVFVLCRRRVFSLQIRIFYLHVKENFHENGFNELSQFSYRIRSKSFNLTLSILLCPFYFVHFTSSEKILTTLKMESLN